MLYYCLQEDRCGGCRYKLEEGETIFAVFENHVQSPELIFLRRHTYHIDELKMSVHMCCQSSCQFRDNSMIGIHSRCCKIMKDFSSRRFEMTQHSLHSHEEQDTRRRQRAVQLLPRRLKANEQFAAAARLLPAELLSLVLSHLTYETAVVSIEAQILDSHALEISRHTTIDVSHDITADLVSLEGVQYIQSLRNPTVMPTAEPGLLLLDTRKKPFPERLYVAEDHLGVRMAIFGRSDRSLPDACTSQKLWWTVLEINTNTKLELEHDGMKLRRVKLSAGPTNVLPPLWNKPVKDYSFIDLEHPLTDLETIHQCRRLQMQGFSCNARGISGYSAHMTRSGVASIFAHRNDENGAAWYRSTGPESRILHMPLDSDERVIAIWSVSFQAYPDSNGLALMFETNRKIAWFGRHFPGATFICYRIRLSQHETNVFFNVESDGIRFLAFEQRPQPSLAKLPDLTQVSVPLDVPSQACFQSSCCLDGASSITLCRDTSLEHQPIIGILITDIHRRKYTLGQFRFDCKLERVQLDYSRSLQVGAARTRRSHLYVTNIWGEGSRPSDYDPTFLLTLPLEGTLVWRFSRQHTELYHSSLQKFWRPLQNMYESLHLGQLRA